MPSTMSHYNIIAHMSDNNICSSWSRNLASIEDFPVTTQHNLSYFSGYVSHKLGNNGGMFVWSEPWCGHIDDMGCRDNEIGTRI